MHPALAWGKRVDDDAHLELRALELILRSLQCGCHRRICSIVSHDHRLQIQRTLEDVAVDEVLLVRALREVLLEHMRRREVDGLLALGLGLDRGGGRRFSCGVMIS